MIIGVAYYAIWMFIINTGAASEDNSKKIRVGISYGSSVTSSYNIMSTNGFAIGYQEMTTENKAFKPVMTTAAKKLTISVASSDGLKVTDPSNNKVIFECSGEVLGIKASGTGTGALIKTDSGYTYEGVFAFSRYTGDGANGVAVTNVLGLETYVEGVLPYEISSSWHIEAQKAFSVAARSYAIGNIGKHEKSYGFDLCNTTNCQVYRGCGGVTSTVKEAVLATKGKVITYNGKAVALYYCSSTGGVTVSAEDCWGGKGAPYMTAVSTPWERYMDYSNGFWTVEVSPTELCNYLSGTKGYTNLKGAIASIDVTYAANSTYVKSITFTDSSGNKKTVTNTDSVRGALGGYVKSANFVVGKGSVEYTASAVKADANVKKPIIDLASFFVMTKSGGNNSVNGTSPVSVLTSSGTAGSVSKAAVITKNGVQGIGAGGYTSTVSKYTQRAQSSGNFVFVGKGWGHGVGLSQYGTKDLGEFGYTWDEILTLYVPTAKIENYVK